MGKYRVVTYIARIFHIFFHIYYAFSLRKTPSHILPPNPIRLGLHHSSVSLEKHVVVLHVPRICDAVLSQYILYFLLMYIALSLGGSFIPLYKPPVLRLYPFHPWMLKDLRAACTSNPRRFQIWIVHQKIHWLKNNFSWGGMCIKTQ